MLELTGFLGLTRIPLGFWAHTDLTDSTVLLCGWEISQMILRVGCAHADSALLLGSHGSHRSHGIALWVGNLTDASVRELAHADSAWFLDSHGSHRFHSIAVWVGNLTDGSVGVGSWWLHGARSHGLIFWTLRTNQTYRTNRTDWTFLKIIREWDLCEASVGLGSV